VKHDRGRSARAWLETRPSLDELRAAYPAEWAVVERELSALAARRDPDALKRYLQTLADSRALSRQARRAQGERDALSAQVRRQMTIAAIEQMLLRAATGVNEGRVRFNLVNGYIAQKLLFERDLERKPVSLRLFRLVWPLLRQRRLLMPLVQPKGIYCFYSKPLIKRIAAMIGDQRCLEIAAGDGTLSRFLRDEGVPITATDDHSWSHTVEYPDLVVRQDARDALRERQPEVVICSWPPPGNTFEREVFETRSVQLYIAINSRHDFASGDRGAYERQDAFTFAEDASLTRLVLPPELEPAVHVFRRKTSAG
jgi:hypothetical protein